MLDTHSGVLDTDGSVLDTCGGVFDTGIGGDHVLEVAAREARHRIRLVSAEKRSYFRFADFSITQLVFKFRRLLYHSIRI